MSNKLSISIPTHGEPLPSQMPHSKRCVSTNGNNPPFHSKPFYRFPSSLPFSTHLFSTSPLKYAIAQSIYKDASLIEDESSICRGDYGAYSPSQNIIKLSPLPSCQNILQVELLGLHHATSFLMEGQHHLHFYNFPLQECFFISSPPLKHTMGICALAISLGQK